MEFHGIDCVGSFKLPQVDTLEPYVMGDDDRKFIRQNSDGVVYYGDDTHGDWKQLVGDYHPINGSITQSMTASEYSGVSNYIKITDKFLTLNSGNGSTEHAGIGVGGDMGDGTPNLRWNSTWYDSALNQYPGGPTSGGAWTIYDGVGAMLSTTDAIATHEWVYNAMSVAGGSIPYGGSAGQILEWAASGAAQWSNNGEGNLSPKGHWKLPGGLIIQWGAVSVQFKASSYESFNISFPNNVFTVTLGQTYPSSGITNDIIETELKILDFASKDGFSYRRKPTGDGGGSNESLENTPIYYMAIGN